MAASPEWKCYDADGKYEGAVKHAEMAAALVSVLGVGATVRHRHRHIVWREGAEEISAAESYDFAAGLMIERTIEGTTAPEMRTNDEPAQGADRCECGCKYWTATGRCIDCGASFKP